MENPTSWVIDKSAYVDHIRLGHSYCFVQSPDGEYIILSDDDPMIKIFPFFENTGKYQIFLELKGHRKPPNVLKCGNQLEPTLLVSAADDYVIKWNVTECTINQHNNTEVRGEVVMQTPEAGISSVSFNFDDTQLALCTECDVIIYDMEKSTQAFLLAGHNSRVSASEFCPHYTNTLVTISHDKTFKIWNTESGQLVYSSFILRSSPPDGITMNATKEQFTLYWPDGTVKVFDVSSHSEFQEIRSFDLDVVLDKEASASYSNGILSMAQVTLTLNSDEEPVIPGMSNHSQALARLFGSVDLLVAVTSSHIVVLNTETGEFTEVYNITEHFSKCLAAACVSTLTMDGESSEDLIAVPCPLLRVIFTCISGTKLNCFDLIPLNLHLRNLAQTDSLSVVSRNPILKSSPLRSTLQPKIAPDPKLKKASSTRGPSKQKMKGATNQPIIMRNTIKSSGYLTHNHIQRKMFQPVTRPKAPSLKTSQKPGNPSINRSYPTNAEPVKKLRGQPVSIDSQPTHIINMKFNYNGQYLALCANNRNGYVFKLPIKRGSNCISLTGHKGVVNSCSWSYSNDYVLTSGEDSTVRLWGKDGSEVMVIDRIDGNLSSNQQNPVGTQKLSPSLADCQFFYMDKFIIVGSGDSVVMYKYHIDTTKSDIERYKNGSRYKLASEFKLMAAQKVTGLSTINSFYSHLIIAVCSDKSIQVVDANKSAISRIVEKCHTRVPTLVRQNQGSIFSMLPTAGYDLFMTSAISDGIKLWDLRTSSCVRKFESHTCQTVLCRSDFSPDGKYITSGSEDKAIYVYDIGTGKVLSKVTGSSAYTSVTHHPIHPIVAAGTVDGNVSIYES